jgi:hypothetical protein
MASRYRSFSRLVPVGKRGVSGVWLKASGPDQALSLLPGPFAFPGSSEVA